MGNLILKSYLKCLEKPQQQVQAPTGSNSEINVLIYKVLLSNLVSVSLQKTKLILTTNAARVSSLMEHTLFTLIVSILNLKLSMLLEPPITMTAEQLELLTLLLASLLWLEPLTLLLLEKTI